MSVCFMSARSVGGSTARITNLDSALGHFQLEACLKPVVELLGSLRSNDSTPFICSWCPALFLAQRRHAVWDLICNKQDKVFSLTHRKLLIFSYFKNLICEISNVLLTMYS